MQGFQALYRDVRHMSARAATDLADWLVHLEVEGKSDRQEPGRQGAADPTGQAPAERDFQ
jgi:hypothetical protein